MEVSDATGTLDYPDTVDFLNYIGSKKNPEFLKPAVKKINQGYLLDENWVEKYVNENPLSKETIQLFTDNDDKNKNFRESLNLHRSLCKIEGVESKVWGLNYPDFEKSFSDIEEWCDVLFIIENYTSEWLPSKEISESKKLKIFWSIDSHCILQQHQEFCKLLNFVSFLIKKKFSSSSESKKSFEKLFISINGVQSLFEPG